MNFRRWNLPVIAVVSAVCVLGSLQGGCDRQQGKAALPPEPPQVAFVTLAPQKVVLTTTLPGRAAGCLVSEIRPQVNGLIQKRLFTEGSDVKAGQALYEIDPAPFQAAYESAVANVEAAKKTAERAKAAIGASSASVDRFRATVKLAKLDLGRLESLAREKAVSASERDHAATDLEVAEASLRAAEAQVTSDEAALAAAQAAVTQAEAGREAARINLGYTKIAAPIAGRIGRSNVTEGATVTAYQPSALATIQSLDPIFVDVPQSTAELNRLKRAMASGNLGSNGTDKVKIVLEDGTAYPLEGSLRFHDVTVDPTTGSVILRIVVPNPGGILLPGMFVRAIIDEGVNPQAILVPQQAVARDPKGDPTVLVVDAGGKVQQRRLTTDRALGDAWLVSSGLAAGDRVVVEGLQKVKPGTNVKAVPFTSARNPEAELRDVKQPATQSN